MQNRPEKLLFFSSSSSGLPEVSAVSLVRKTVLICLSVLWSFLCTKSFYKIHESPNVHFEDTEYNPNFVPGRYPLHSTDQRRSDTCEGYIDFSIAESRILFCSPTLSEDRISRKNCQLEGNDPVSSLTEGNSNSRAMSNFSFK